MGFIYEETNHYGVEAIVALERYCTPSDEKNLHRRHGGHPHLRDLWHSRAGAAAARCGRWLRRRSTCWST